MGARAAKTMKQKAGAIETPEQVLELLERKATKATRDGMKRFGIEVKQAFGVPVGTLRQIAKTIGTNHDLALALWKHEWYEARMLAAFIGDPKRLTAAEMERWCRDFDNWAIVDTACFALFDRCEHAWPKVAEWSKRRNEFEKRAAFALLWSLTVHDKEADDERFLAGLELIEREAKDERHFVKKAINMALRAVGKRNRALNAAAIAAATRLRESNDEHARWIGQDALRELTSASVTRRLGKKAARKGS